MNVRIGEALTTVAVATGMAGAKTVVGDVTDSKTVDVAITVGAGEVPNVAVNARGVTARAPKSPPTTLSRV